MYATFTVCTQKKNTQAESGFAVLSAKTIPPVRRSSVQLMAGKTTLALGGAIVATPKASHGTSIKLTVISPHKMTIGNRQSPSVSFTRSQSQSPTSMWPMAGRISS